MLSLLKPAALLAEFFGTAILVMVTLVLTQTTHVSYFIGTSAAITLIAVYMMFAKISQAHVNPAITLGMWTTGRIATVPAIGYIVAQVLGALSAWGMYSYFASIPLLTQKSVWSWKLFWAEAVGALILAMGFGAAVSKGLRQLESALTYGFSLFVGIMFVAGASAAYLNPSTALAIMRFHWDTAYILGPVAGAVIGLNIYNYMFGGAKMPALKFNVKPAKK